MGNIQSKQIELFSTVERVGEKQNMYLIHTITWLNVNKMQDKSNQPRSRNVLKKNWNSFLTIKNLFENKKGVSTGTLF